MVLPQRKIGSGNAELLHGSLSIWSFRKGKHAKANLKPGIPCVFLVDWNSTPASTMHTLLSFLLLFIWKVLSELGPETWTALTLDRLYCVSWEYQIQKEVLEGLGAATLGSSAWISDSQAKDLVVAMHIGWPQERQAGSAAQQWQQSPEAWQWMFFSFSS